MKYLKIILLGCILYTINLTAQPPMPGNTTSGDIPTPEQGINRTTPLTSATGFLLCSVAAFCIYNIIMNKRKNKK
jgi:hypothetical protein